jgi:hypothetical protein
VSRRAAGAERFPFRSQEVNNMMFLLSTIGLRYNEKITTHGAQTERRGGAGPERNLLGGGTSPAALLKSAIPIGR